jgi:hypothetical protein
MREPFFPRPRQIGIVVCDLEATMPKYSRTTGIVGWEIFGARRCIGGFTGLAVGPKPGRWAHAKPAPNGKRARRD